MESSTNKNDHQPLVSCICITHNRPKQLIKAIANFENQSYNNKELIVSYPESDVLTKELLAKISEYSLLKINTLYRNEETTLGAAKNAAILTANGEYICIWDDDDYHGPDRLLHQITSLESTNENYQASILSKIILYDSFTERANLSFYYNWSGTLLCRKKMLLQHPYPASNYLEDVNLITFLESNKLLQHIDNAFDLYIYIYHGANEIDYNHFRYFMRNSLKLDDKFNEKIHEVVKEDVKFVD